ncbi:arsenate reductase ArsC [Chitinolyticbacter meiyuanensis]|uniref:arsenate reductase ArsC n=1 Tax=Chitinolyticbacter meiyuanensis TaxID=682798 RepID=UPI0011E59398|nr:arsenate reductase ArsC [Chitinolyticbacter meiyuanensis]
MSTPVLNVLFLCTANSARSVMSEGWLNVLGEGRFKAYSAGSHPSGRVNPHAIALLDGIGYDTSSLHSKSWDVFEGADAPHMDIVVTVCGNAKNEVCPMWPGHPTTAHWGYEDPHGDTDDALRASFEKIFQQIRKRTELLVQAPEERLQGEALKQLVREIGETSVE